MYCKPFCVYKRVLYTFLVSSLFHEFRSLSVYMIIPINVSLADTGVTVFAKIKQIFRKNMLFFIFHVYSGVQCMCAVIT